MMGSIGTSRCCCDVSRWSRCGTILGDPGAASRDEGIFVGESLLQQGADNLFSRFRAPWNIHRLPTKTQNTQRQSRKRRRIELVQKTANYPETKLRVMVLKLTKKMKNSPSPQNLEFGYFTFFTLDG